MVSLTKFCSHIDKFFWPKGIQLLDQKSTTYTGVVKGVLKAVLQVEDPIFGDELFPFFSRLFHKRLQKKLDNIKSKYRTDITEEGELVGSCDGKNCGAF